MEIRSEHMDVENRQLSYSKMGKRGDETLGMEKKGMPHDSKNSHRFPLRAIGQVQQSATLSSSTSDHVRPSTSRRPLLRYGERMESLFGLDNPSCTESYRKDCQTLVASKEDNTSTWKSVLEFATKNGILTGVDLIRLHRRATTRISVPSPTSPLNRLPKQPHEHLESLLAIWLSYADAQMGHRMEKDARMTLQHVGSWASQNPKYILHLARFEERCGNATSAFEVLHRGMEGVDPIHHKTEAFVELKRKYAQVCGETSKSPKRQKTLHEQSPGPNQSTIMPEPARFNLAPLRVRQATTQDGAKPKNMKPSILRKDATGESQLGLPVVTHESSASQSFDLGATPTTANIKSSPSVKFLESSLMETPGKPILNLSNTRLRSSGTRKPLVRMARKLTGKAKRVDPSSMDQTDSGDEEDQSLSTGDLPETKPKIKMDLSYIFEWDPNKRFSGGKNELKSCDQKETKLSSINERGSPSEKKTRFVEKDSSKWNPSIEEREPKLETANAVDRPPLKTTNAVERPPITTTAPIKTASAEVRGIPLESGKNELNNRKPPTSQQQLKSSSTVQSPAPKTATSISGIQPNLDFLPFVDEKNVIYVNRTPYLKLGRPVGKGGSCKVYRALARDSSIVAIKKVKLAGMDKKSIESYANEIDLLRSLRGCSSIIQMFDSDVNMQRKAIHVVMELGEADLNHVLRKQSEGDGRRLNMTFVRLTWHQMLTAVHCIHEAKIIHGDLKPANFLFVKGTLKLIDFGIAKAIQSDDTTNIYRDSQIGTLNYMSPEAILESGTGTDKPKWKLGRASDIWSLGCILYQMIYGQTPFANLQMLPKLQAIVNPSYEIKFAGNVDSTAIDAMKQCLRRKPETRPPIVGKAGLLNEHPFLVSPT